MNALDETVGYLYFTRRSLAWVRHQLGYLPTDACPTAYTICDRIADDLSRLSLLIAEHRTDKEAPHAQP